MNDPIKLFDAEALPPTQSPEARIIRAGARALELHRLLSPQHTADALRRKAEGHGEAALRNIEQADASNDLRVRLASIAEAGHHADAALVALTEAERRS